MGELEPSVLKLDQDALLGSKELLLDKSKAIVETVFGPMDSRHVHLTTDEKKSINTFIRKIDPRAPLSTERKLNIRALILKECNKQTEDGRIDPKDKKLLRSSPSLALKPKKYSQSIQRNMVLKELDLHLCLPAQEV